MNFPTSLPMILACVIVVLAIPMVLEKIPLNRYYGFRTPKTMSSPDIWYRANKLAGINLMASGLISLLAWVVMTMMYGAAKAGVISFPVFIFLTLVALIVSLVQLNKL